MGSTLIISPALISLVLLVLRICYYKLSIKNEKVIERGYYGGGLFDFSIATKIFFPIRQKFDDDIKIKRLKKKANNFLYAFYFSVGITYIMILIFDK